MASYGYTRQYEAVSPAISPAVSPAGGSSDGSYLQSKEPEINVEESRSGSALPPKTLKPWTKTWAFIRHLLVGVIAACVLTGAIMYGVTAYLTVTAQVESDYTDDLCDKQSASPSQRRFVIDVRLGGNFTFTQEKLIDVAWDLIIG
jgi:hypothetical protein